MCITVQTQAVTIRTNNADFMIEPSREDDLHVLDRAAAERAVVTLLPECLRAGIAGSGVETRHDYRAKACHIPCIQAYSADL